MYTDWIQGEKFIGIADYVYVPHGAKKDLYNLQNTLCVDELRDADVIYTHTDHIPQLFELIANWHKEVIVVSHNSDACAETHIPENVIKWHSQNVNMLSDKVQSLPIGLENNRWFPKIGKKELMLSLLERPRIIKNLVYVNHNIKTNKAERQPVYDLLAGKQWATLEMGKNGSNFEHYLQSIYNHRFVVCPEGNGMDTHRTWECLYLGTIPIEKRNNNNLQYTDLPISFVNSWDEITPDFLMSEYIRIHDMQWDRSKLTFEYWKNKIRNYV